MPAFTILVKRTDHNNVRIDDEYMRFLEDFQMQTGPYAVSKVINVPITFAQNIDWPNNDTRSIFFSKRSEGPGIFREKLKDDEGNSIKSLTYFVQGIHPKFVHQFLYKDFLYVNSDSVRKKPSTAQDLVSDKELARRENIIKELLEERIKNNSDVVAIGETGFELYYDFEKRVCDHPAYQEKWFRYHLDLAYEYDLPLIIHLRSGERKEQNANKWALKVLQEYKAQGKLRSLPGVIHCFIGNKSEAAEFHRLGFVLGIGAAFTYGDPHDSRNLTKVEIVNDGTIFCSVFVNAELMKTLFIQVLNEQVSQVELSYFSLNAFLSIVSCERRSILGFFLLKPLFFIR